MYNVILPTYNEADNITILVRMLSNVFHRLDCKYILIVVDDNSADGTAEEVEKLQIQMGEDQLKLIRRPRKMGLGSAYFEGVEYCKYDYTIIMDCDLQHNPFDILEMSKYKEYDIVTGTRYTLYELKENNGSVDMGCRRKAYMNSNPDKKSYENKEEVGHQATQIINRSVGNRSDVFTKENSPNIKNVGNNLVIKYGCVCGWSFKRKLVSSVANTLAKFVLDLKSTDLTGSYRIYKTGMLKKLLKSVRNQGFGFQMEIIVRAEEYGATIKEVPITFYDRSSGESKMQIIEILKYLKSIVWLYFVG